jgi:hypothetical protein
MAWRLHANLRSAGGASVIVSQLDEGPRQYVRAPLAAVVRTYEWDRLTPLQGRDLGGGGIFLETSSPLPYGSLLTLRIDLPDRRAFTVLARVVRQSESGMGVAFIDLSADDRRAVLDYVATRRG